MESQSPRLLVVDDDPAIREYLITRLDSEGFAVLAAEDVPSARQVLLDNPDIDLILLDVIMPGPSGFELLTALKKDEQFSEIPVIMVTALGLVEDKELAFRLGAGDYLTKPFDTREMLARIRTHITLKNKKEELIQKNKLLTTILSTVPGIVYLKDEERRFQHVNNLFEEMYGISAEEITGNSDDALFSDELTESFKRSEALIFSYGVPYLENVEDVILPTGEIRNIFFRRQPVMLDGEVSGLVGVGIDMTEQVILRNILASRESSLMTLMNTFPARIWALNCEYEFTEQNAAHIARWGNFIGKRIDEVTFEPSYRDILKKGIDLAMNRKKQFSLFQCPGDKRKMILLLWLLPILNGDDLTGVMGISIDLPESCLKDPELKSGEFTGVCSDMPE